MSFGKFKYRTISTKYHHIIKRENNSEAYYYEKRFIFLEVKLQWISKSASNEDISHLRCEMIYVSRISPYETNISKLFSKSA